MSDNQPKKTKGTRFRVDEVSPQRPPPRPMENARRRHDLEDLPYLPERPIRERREVSTAERQPAPILRPTGGLDIADEPPAPRSKSLQAVQRADALLHRDEPRPAYRRTPAAPEPVRHEIPWLTLLPILAISAMVIWYFWMRSPETSFSNYVNRQGVISAQAVAVTPVTNLAARPSESSVLGAPSISAAKIDDVLAAYGSPAAGSGEVWIAMSRKYGIDAAYALAFFIHESGAGTNPQWAGIKDDGSTTHNIGNIICAGYSTCYNRFRDYPSWKDGIEDWYALIAVEYVEGRGAYTIEQIIPIYAPAFENNVPAYVNGVNSLVFKWRAGG